MTAFSFQAPRVIRFGRGVLAETGPLAGKLGWKRALLVTTPGAPGRPAYRSVADSLSGSGVALAGTVTVGPEPTQADWARGVGALKAAAPDGVVGLGGGAALDVAKLVAMSAANPGPLDLYLGVGKVPRPGLPAILLPTTAGSGSEVSPDAVLSDPARGTKVAVKDPHLVAAAALVDPEPLASVPRAVAAACGMDALIQALEAYTSLKATPWSDAHALESLRLLGRHLETALSGDEAAREAVALGSLHGGLAFGNAGTALVHALGYPLSARYGAAHGVANALMLPEAVRFNLEASGKFRVLEDLLGRPLPEALRRLAGALGLPTRLRDIGVPREACAGMAAVVLPDRRHLDANPRSVGLSDLERLFEASW